MFKEENYKMFIKIVSWLTAFAAVIRVYFIVFGLLISPGGATGTFKSGGAAASFAYIALWLGLSILAGYKQYKEILAAAMIYSAIPVIGLICGLLFIGTPLGIGVMLLFFWSAPIQGMSYGNEGLIRLMVFIQPLLFVVGYSVPAYLRKLRRSANM